MPVELLRRALRALADTPLRTSLTVSGIAIGIAALFSLLSIAEGIRSRVVNEWMSSGLMTSLSVTPEGTMRSWQGGARSGARVRSGANRSAPAAPDRQTASPRTPGGSRNSSEPRRALDDTVLREIAAIPGVRRVWPVISRSVSLALVEPKTPAQPPSLATTADAAEAGPGEPPAAGAGSIPDRDDHSLPPSSPSSPGSNSSRDDGSPPLSASSSADARPTERASAARSDSTASGPEPKKPAAAPPRERVGPGADEERLILRGFETDFFWRDDYLKIVAGAPFTDPGASEALLAADRLEPLGIADAPSSIGRSVTLRWREPVPSGTVGGESVPGLPFSMASRSAEFKIVGVFERGGGLSLRSAAIIVPTAAAGRIESLNPELVRSLFEGGSSPGGYPGLDVYTVPGADLEAIESRIKSMGFETISGAEIVGRIQRSILVLQAVLGGLGSIAIAVATLGIVNTLITAVYERMREIGVMKAVGARRRDIRRQFLAEAGMIGLGGGVIGLAAGFAADHLLSLVIDQIVRRQGEHAPGSIAVHSPQIAFACLAFSVAISLLAGTFPAARAARLDPVVTLRHE